MPKITIRDIIVNACDAARLVNRNQPIPGNIFLSAYTLLQRRLDGYSNTHFLSFLQKECTFDAKPDVILGKYVPKDEYVVAIVDSIVDKSPSDYPLGSYVFDRTERKIYAVQNVMPGEPGFAEMPDPENYFTVYPDVEINDLHEITRCYAACGEAYDRWLELDYVSFEDFYDRAYGNGVYTVNIKSDDEQLLKVKEPLVYQQLKIVYTAPFDFDQDTELNIPRQYIALFTAGLTYDLATAYPRMGDSTVALLKQRLDELEENVRRSSSVNKFVGRDRDWSLGMTRAEFLGGTWLL